MPLTLRLQSKKNEPRSSPKRSARSFFQKYLLGNPLTKKIDRWKVSVAGYIVDRRVFLVYSGLVILYGLYLMNSLGWDLTPHFYLYCSDEATGGRCDNPCYQDYGPYCKPYSAMQTLPAGFEVGERPPAIIEGYLVISILGGIIAVALNSFLFNDAELKEYERLP